jgi:hypothetical protein
VRLLSVGMDPSLALGPPGSEPSPRATRAAGAFGEGSRSVDTRRLTGLSASQARLAPQVMTTDADPD